MHESVYAEMARVEERFWWFAAKRRVVLDLIRRHAPAPNGRRRMAADIGCGTGGLLSRLEADFDAIGFESAEAARAACADRGLEVGTCFLPDDLPLEPGSVDVAVMSDVLEHLEHDGASVRAVRDRLRPGGIVVCTVPAHMWMWTKRDDDHHHYRRYDRRGYERLFTDAGLEPVVVSWYMTVLFPLMVAQRAADKLRGGHEGSTDISIPPGPVNALLETAFASERHAIGRVPMPFGGSLVSVHRRPLDS